LPGALRVNQCDVDLVKTLESGTSIFYLASAAKQDCSKKPRYSLQFCAGFLTSISKKRSESIAFIYGIIGEMIEIFNNNIQRD